MSLRDRPRIRLVRVSYELFREHTRIYLQALGRLVRGLRR